MRANKRAHARAATSKTNTRVRDSHPPRTPASRSTSKFPDAAGGGQGGVRWAARWRLKRRPLLVQAGRRDFSELRPHSRAKSPAGNLPGEPRRVRRAPGVRIGTDEADAASRLPRNLLPSWVYEASLFLSIRVRGCTDAHALGGIRLGRLQQQQRQQRLLVRREMRHGVLPGRNTLRLCVRAVRAHLLRSGASALRLRMYPRHGQLLQPEHWNALSDGHGLLRWRLHPHRHVVLFGWHVLPGGQGVLQLGPVLLICEEPDDERGSCAGGDSAPRALAPGSVLRLTPLHGRCGHSCAGAVRVRDL